MGSGAASGLSTAIDCVSAQELAETFTELPPSARAKVVKACDLGSKRATPKTMGTVMFLVSFKGSASLKESLQKWEVLELDLPPSAKDAVDLLAERFAAFQAPQKVAVVGFPRTLEEAKLFEERIFFPAKVVELADRHDASMLPLLDHYDNHGILVKVAAKSNESAVAAILTKCSKEVDELIEMQAKFWAADTGNTGTITFEQLKAIIANSGHLVTEEEVLRLMEEYDEEKTGRLSFAQFVNLMERELWLEHKLEDAKAVFEAADKSGTGDLNAEELREVFNQIADPKTLEETKDIIKKYDKNNSETLCFAQFLDFLRHEQMDLMDIKAALDMLDEVQNGENEYEMDGEWVGHPPGFLLEALVELVQKNKSSLQNLDGLDDEGTSTIAGVLIKLVLDIVQWEGEAPFEAFPAESQGWELLKEIANKRGWDWKNKEGAKPDSLIGMPQLFKEMAATHGGADLTSVIVAMLHANKANLDTMSLRYGPNFDECIVQMMAGLVTWDVQSLGEDGIKALDEPAIFAFSFGTGDKIGPALDMPTKVGPGCETPGKTNEGLAEMIKKVLAVRPMPVFAQWEIADALLHGGKGHPRPESFYEWQFGDEAAGGDKGKAGEWYGRIEEFEVTPGGAKVKVYKSLPIWPLAVQKKLVPDEEHLRDAGTMRKYYLSTVGVLEQNESFWKDGFATKPKSTIVIGHMDHAKRCQKLVQDLLLPDSDGGKKTMNLGPSELPVPDFYPANWSNYSCDKFGYDPESTQKWTRSRPLFFAHEATARSMQYVREDFGPLPIHSGRKLKDAVHKEFASHFVAEKLAGKDRSLLALLAPNTEYS